MRAQIRECEIRSPESPVVKKENKEVEPPPIQQCKLTMDLKGPFSPLEMKIYSLISTGDHKKVTIDPNSVNTVLLDEEPQDPHERYITALFWQFMQLHVPFVLG